MKKVTWMPVPIPAPEQSLSDVQASCEDDDDEFEDAIDHIDDAVLRKLLKSQEVIKTATVVDSPAKKQDEIYLMQVNFGKLKF
jgi:hypothetical protein